MVLSALKKHIYILLLLLISVATHAVEIYKTTSDLKLRKGASPNSKSLGVIKFGTTLEIIDRTNKEWFKTEYDGKVGYVFSKYLVLVQAEPKKVIVPPSPIKEEEKSSTWGWILLFGSLILFILHRRSKKSKVLIQKNSVPSSDSSKKTFTGKTNTNYSKKDDDIIDVTGKPQPLYNGLVRYIQRVPIWQHHYIYSFSEIESATDEQKAFYKVFKNAFLSGQYLDLEGNLNYAFILLFDLANNYDKSNYEIEKQLTALGKYYPKTQSYAVSILEEKSQKAGIVSDPMGYSKNVYNSQYDYEDWRLGSRYKTKLNPNEVKILNTLIDTDNKFNSIEHCALELIQLFLYCVNSLEEIFKKQGTTLQDESNAIAVIEIAKHYKYRAGSYNYKSVYEVFINNIYQAIYKLCENKLRDFFDVGRKTDLSWYIHSEQALMEFRFKFEIHLDPILTRKIKEVKEPDIAGEISLNEYNKARWKGKSERLEVRFDKSKVDEYLDGISELEKTNQKNPSIENIFFQASKFISKYDKTAALKFYIDYLHYDLKSVKFDNKQLTKTIQKSLFTNEQQLKDFEVIVSNLVKDKNREKALNAVSQLYAPKRKKIVLDTTTIQEVHEKHSDTVQLLNEYLQDDTEESQKSESPEKTDNAEVKLEVLSSDENEKASHHASLNLNVNQSELLELISKNSYSVTLDQVEAFAKSKGVFRNQLIESINEAFYEALDDLLIEEEDENYIINETYYQKLFVQ